MIIGRSHIAGGLCPAQSLRYYCLRHGRPDTGADRWRHILERRAQEGAFGEIHAAIIRAYADRLLGDRPTKGFPDTPPAVPDPPRPSKPVFLYRGIWAVGKDTSGNGAATLIDPQVDARFQ